MYSPTTYLLDDETTVGSEGKTKPAHNQEFMYVDAIDHGIIHISQRNYDYNSRKWESWSEEIPAPIENFQKFNDGVFDFQHIYGINDINQEFHYFDDRHYYAGIVEAGTGDQHCILLYFEDKQLVKEESFGGSVLSGEYDIDNIKFAYDEITPRRPQ